MAAQTGVDNRNGSLRLQTPASGHLLPSLVPNSPSMTSMAARPGSRVSAISLNEKVHDGQSPTSRTKSHSVSNTTNTAPSSRGSVSADPRRQRAARTLPPWVQTLEHSDGAPGQSHADGHIEPPGTIRPASHNFMPEPKGAAFGRHFDHAREGVPVTITSPLAENANRWQQFTKSTDPRPSTARTRGEIVDDEWMKLHLPDLETPWHPEDEEAGDDDEGIWLFDPQRRKRKLTRVRRNVMNHPMVPLAVRLTVLTFSCLALGLAGSIFRRAGNRAGCDRGSSTYLAIIIDVVAILYTAYITYDEYTSKPLGLRSHRAKMRLIFFDLIFIVFDSANLSLAFEALTDDRWACRNKMGSGEDMCSYDEPICTRQRALTATLLIALVAWLITFAISTLRLIEKVASR